VRRLLSTFLVLGLLGGTAGAFAVTERLKLEPSPIAAPDVDHVLSPVCGCETRTADIEFRIREADQLTIAIVDADGEVVRTLVSDREYDAGPVALSWDGRGDEGEVVEEGSYRPRVHLDDERRTIVLPNPMRVDTTAPVVTVVSVAPTVISPDRDGRSDKIKVRYRVDELARPYVLVDGEEETIGRTRPGGGQLEWYGRHDGRPVSTGPHAVSVVATDLAGNRSRPTPRATVWIRYISIARDQLRVPAGVRFGVRVSTDAARYRWRLGHRRGSRRGELLVVRAPSRPGRYLLRVEYGHYRDRAVVVVEPRP
jgi:FlgD Ig-like domain